MSSDCLFALLSFGFVCRVAWRFRLECARFADPGEAADSGEARYELPDTVTGRSKNGGNVGEKERVLDGPEMPAGRPRLEVVKRSNRQASCHLT